MVEVSRYSVSDEGAGVAGKVLKNKLGIKDQKKLSDAETVLLADTYDYLFDLLEKGKIVFNLALLFDIHKFFLGTLYSWAGKIRTIDISKDEMLFAPVKHINKSIRIFEKITAKNIITLEDDKKVIARKLAVIHNEFNAIHPFREGNGRTIRLFLDLFVGSVGYSPIDWSKKLKKEYIKACIEGLVSQHEGMEKIIYSGLTKKK